MIYINEIRTASLILCKACRLKKEVARTACSNRALLRKDLSPTARGLANCASRPI